MAECRWMMAVLPSMTMGSIRERLPAEGISVKFPAARSNVSATAWSEAWMMRILPSVPRWTGPLKVRRRKRVDAGAVARRPLGRDGEAGAGGHCAQGVDSPGGKERGGGFLGGDFGACQVLADGGCAAQSGMVGGRLKWAKMCYFFSPYWPLSGRCFGGMGCGAVILPVWLGGKRALLFWLLGGYLAYLDRRNMKEMRVVTRRAPEVQSLSV
jgi:hypothetical protein